MSLQPFLPMRSAGTSFSGIKSASVKAKTCAQFDFSFSDKGVNFAIQKGLLASRSRVEFFNHNDVADLERLLLIQADKDKQV